MDGLRLLIAAAGATVLAGCATLDRTVDSTDAAGISRIGVASALGDEMNHIFIGTIVFENARATRAVPEWEMRLFAEKEMVSMLEASPKVSSAGVVDVTGLDRSQFWDNQAKLLAAAKEQGFDTVALILPASYSNQPFMEPGYGVFRKLTFGLTHDCIYQQTIVQVLDVASGERLAWEWGFNSWDGSCLESAVPFKYDVGSYTPQEMETLNQEIRGAFSFGFERTVRKLGLGTAGAYKAVGTRPH
ncbi:MAG: hypothetical protein AAFY01_04160 [Pseudomonadota bacterium]